jgi:hypothetical protein
MLAGSLRKVCNAHTSAFGVGSVCINMVRRATAATIGAAFCDHCCILGRCCSGDAVMGDVFWCKHRVAIRVAVERNCGVVREMLRIAVRGTCNEAILKGSIAIKRRA